MSCNRTYQKRRSEGLCVDCGGEIEEERKGKARCKKCADKNNEGQRLDRAAYIKNGICPLCKTRRLVGDEHRCYECRVKDSKRVKRYQDKEKAIDPIGYTRKRTESCKRTRQKYASQGLCVNCGRVKSEEYRLCEKCRQRNLEYCRRWRERRNEREQSREKKASEADSQS